MGLTKPLSLSVQYPPQNRSMSSQETSKYILGGRQREFRLFFSQKELPVVQEAARIAGIANLVVLASEKEPYETLKGVRGTVAKGQVYVNLVPEAGNLVGFWDEFRRLQQSGKLPGRKPPASR